jgi:alpha-ketoglutarate-dependent taurine dioxygenase
MTDTFGLVVQERASEVHPVELAELLEGHAAVLLKGIHRDQPSTDALIKAVSEAQRQRLMYHFMGLPRFVESPRFRKIHFEKGAGHQYVDAGTERLRPHQENGYVPWRPDTLWFVCLSAADQGGESLLCDGVAVWRDLRPSTQELFLERRMSFDMRRYVDIPERARLTFFGTRDREETLGYLARFADVRLASDDGGRPNGAWYEPRAVVATAGGPLAFCNSLIGPYDFDTTTLDDGSAVSDDVLSEIDSVYDKHLVALALEPGDVVLIDNRRVLHGRNAFVGNRQIMSYMATTQPIPPLLEMRV